MAEDYQTLGASMDGFERKLDELMIMMAKRYRVSLLVELLSRRYFDPIIQRNVQDVQKVDLKEQPNSLKKKFLRKMLKMTISEVLICHDMLVN